MNELNRRNFIKRSATFAASVIVAPSLIPARALGKNGSVALSVRINLVMIGSGNQGLNDMGEFLKDSRVQITGICDVNKMSGGYWNGGMGSREVGIKKVNDYYSKLHQKTYTGCQSKKTISFINHQMGLGMR